MFGLEQVDTPWDLAGLVPEVVCLEGVEWRTKEAGPSYLRPLPNLVSLDFEKRCFSGFATRSPFIAGN